MGTSRNLKNNHLLVYTGVKEKFCIFLLKLIFFLTALNGWSKSQFASTGINLVKEHFVAWIL